MGKISRAIKSVSSITALSALLKRCGTESMATTLMRRLWRWISHVTRQEASMARTVALHWTPEGKRKRGRPIISVYGGERNVTDGKDLEEHFSHGEGPEEVEGSHCYTTRHPA